MLHYPLRTLIVEDKESDLEILTELLKKHKDYIFIDKTATNFEDAKAILHEKEFALYIFDVGLDISDCYELIHLFNIQEIGIIALNTDKRDVDHDKIRDVGKYLFLKKSYASDRIDEFIIELKAMVEKRNDQEKKELFFKFGQLNPSFFVLVKENHISSKIPYADIYYFESADTSTRLFTKKRPTSYTINGNIGKHNYLVESGVFVKCSRSCFINRYLIEGVSRSRQVIYFDLTNKDCLNVQYSDWFKTWLDDNKY